MWAEIIRVVLFFYGIYASIRYGLTYGFIYEEQMYFLFMQFITVSNWWVLRKDEVKLGPVFYLTVVLGILLIGNFLFLQDLLHFILVLVITVWYISTVLYEKRKRRIERENHRFAASHRAHENESNESAEPFTSDANDSDRWI